MKIRAKITARYGAADILEYLNWSTTLQGRVTCWHVLHQVRNRLDLDQLVLLNDQGLAVAVLQTLMSQYLVILFLLEQRSIFFFFTDYFSFQLIYFFFLILFYYLFQSNSNFKRCHMGGLKMRRVWYQQDYKSYIQLER